MTHGIEHRADCQLGLDGVPGLCTCDFDKRMEAAGWFHCPYCAAGLDRTAETGGLTFIHVLTRDEHGRIERSRPCTRKQ
jgi:hypothetical protein